MDKKSQYLPVTSNSARPPPKQNKRYLLLPILISLFALFHLSKSQLLFPNQLSNQLPFNPPDYEEVGVERKGEEEASLNVKEVWLGDRSPRIAVIGAGAGGSSALYFLKFFSSLTSRNLSTSLTLYESSSYIGGRSTVLYPWLSDPYTPASFAEENLEEPIELGASIFVEANENLQKAVREFGLETTEYSGGEQGETGVWDGEKFVFREKGDGGSWWTKAKLLWRYGRSPFKVKALVKGTVDSFVSLYSRSFVSSPLSPFTSYANFSTSLGLLPPAQQYASDFFAQEGVSELFTNELISAGTQVNYGTPIDEIHGLGALVSLAANGAVSVKGGNKRIFEEFVLRSGAEIRLETKVKEILRLDEDGDEKENEGEKETSSNRGRARWVIKTQDGNGGGVYDAVILAAPYHQTGISIPQLASSHIPPPQPYVKLYVTILLTNATHPSPSYFSLKENSNVPNSIFSTFTTKQTSNVTRKPNFNSLNYLKPLPWELGLPHDPTNSTVHVVKVFSSTSLLPNATDELDRLFGQGNVLKVIEKEWLSYPKLSPIVDAEKELARIRLDDGLYYVNGMERLISTMETETVSAYNVVNLIMRDFFGYKPVMSWAEWGKH